MNRNTIIILLAAVVAVVAVAGSSFLLAPINTQREDLQLTYNPDVTENLPPEVGIWYSALGSFRGLIVNLLWMRATTLKEEGKFYEARELSELICQLQPRFPKVWEFHAWNMAYNISVATHTPRERWMWVKNGIELLRDRGIPLNPTSAALYRQLAWIFLHKVGQFSDDMHWYYKQQLAFEWQTVLGKPPTGSAEQVLDAFRPIAEMDARYFALGELNPDIRQAIDALILERDDLAGKLRPLRTLSPEAFEREAARLVAGEIDERETAVIERLNELRSINEAKLGRTARDPVAAFLADHPEVGPLVDDLRRQGFSPDYDLLTRLGRSVMLLDALDAGYNLGPSFGTDPVDQYLFGFLRDQSPAAAVARDQVFLPFLRAKVLREHYHMSPTVMMEIMRGDWLITEDYPEAQPMPLDWRHPASHGLYWSLVGVRAAQPKREKTDAYYFENLNTYRQVLHAMQALVHNGQIIFDPFDNYYEQLPDPRFIIGYEMAAYGAGAQIGGKYVDSTAIQSFQAGHENFLIWATSLAYFWGYEQDAQRFYERLRKTYGDEPGRAEEYTVPLEQFVMADALENITSLDDAKQMIGGLIRQSLMFGYVTGRPEAAQANMKLAQDMYRYYQNKQNHVTLNMDRNRMSLPGWPELVADTFTQFLLAPSGSVPTAFKQRAWRNLPDYNKDGSPNELKQRVWDRVRESLRAEVERLPAGGPTFQQRFPEPPGMEAYRRANPAEAPKGVSGPVPAAGSGQGATPDR